MLVLQLCVAQDVHGPCRQFTVNTLPTKVFTDLADRGQGSPPTVIPLTRMAMKTKLSIFRMMFILHTAKPPSERCDVRSSKIPTTQN